MNVLGFYYAFANIALYYSKRSGLDFGARPSGGLCSPGNVLFIDICPGNKTRSIDIVWHAADANCESSIFFPGLLRSFELWRDSKYCFSFFGMGMSGSLSLCNKMCHAYLSL